MKRNLALVASCVLASAALPTKHRPDDLGAAAAEMLEAAVHGSPPSAAMASA